MNINLNNIIFKKEKFNFDNLIISNHVNKEFINLDYQNNNNYIVEGLFFETEWTKLLTDYFEIEANNKYIIELPLIENYILYKIIDKLDIKFNSYIMNMNRSNIFINSIKNNNIPKYNFNYQFIKLKLNLNNCKIYLNDKIYNNSIEEIDFEKYLIKFQISTHGVWKYNNKNGFSWRIINMFLQTSETTNIEHYIEKKYIKDEDYDYNNSSNSFLNFKIPNFELEWDI